MHTFIRTIRSIRTVRQRDEDGASAVEYGLLVAGIAALVVVIVFAFGGVIKNSFDTTCKKVKGGSVAAATCS